MGGKGANLGELVKAGIPVPDAFVVSASAYYDFIKSNKIDVLIKKELSGFDPDKSSQLESKSKVIQAAIAKAKFSDYLKKSIIETYKHLGKDAMVAVRSSATAEDLPEASFAGQQETYLNIQGETELLKACQLAYESLFAARAIYYRSIHNFDHLKVGLAIPVQIMIESEQAGIMFTTNPVNQDDNQIVIDAGLGLGEAVVSGSVNPDQYIVNKQESKIIEKNIAHQAFSIVYRNGKNVHVKLSKTQQGSQKLSDEQILELREFALKIERHYGSPQDTEWAYGSPMGDSTESKLYFVQSRPITTLNRIKNQESRIKNNQEPKPGEVGTAILHGVASSVGVATGPVKIIHHPDEIGDVKQGDVLVTEMTNPSYVPAMHKAVAIVTDTGGATSHAAIVSREMGKPAVVGTSQATSKLHDGMIVTVDGAAGIVYEGSIDAVSLASHHKGQSNPHTGHGFLGLGHHNLHAPITATKVYVNLAEISEATEVAKLPCDGVGLLRAEFMIAELGRHPKALVAAGRSKHYVEALVEGMSTIAKAFSPRPVVYRATDFKTNEYRGLKGGDQYEPEEENPMIGYRGAMRYIKDPDMFELELKALQLVRTKHELKNLHLMIPFVRGLDELAEVQKLIAKAGLVRSRDFKLWIMVEVPSSVILIDKFCRAGIDGVSIGSNDLTQLTLGVDRDNGGLAESFDERDEAVGLSLEKVVRSARRHHVTSSICGNAVSVYPEVLETVVRAGITSVSVTPDRVLQTKKLLASIEKRIVLDKSIEKIKG